MSFFRFKFCETQASNDIFVYIHMVISKRFLLDGGEAVSIGAGS
jgi:hypothetical protein